MPVCGFIDARTRLSALYGDNVINKKISYEQATHKKDKIIQELMNVLNETEFCFPSTNLTLFYKFVS